jgi:hypothetical protein
MAEAVHNAEQEFWRPPIQQAQELNLPIRTEVEACARCSTEYAIGARFCHVCGAGRDSQQLPTSEGKLTRFLDFHIISAALGLSAPSLVAFIVGLGCILGAIATGLVFSAATVLDWQAVQIWRIQWLLAGVASFLAAILLRR